MCAALHAIPIPDDVVARLFHAAALLREHRGDLHGPFSETALYVLVRRAGTWWLAADRTPDPAATASLRSPPSVDVPADPGSLAD